MNMKNFGSQCRKCGRPWRKAAPCPCSCPMGTGEYGRKVAGCIRNKNPECPYNAVIPSVTVETTDGIKDLRDCFVHVSNINTTFYIDDKGRMMITWAGPVETTDYDIAGNPLKLRSQTLFDKTGNKESLVYYDKTATPHIMSERTV